MTCPFCHFPIKGDWRDLKIQCSGCGFYFYFDSLWQYIKLVWFKNRKQHELAAEAVIHWTECLKRVAESGHCPICHNQIEIEPVFNSMGALPKGFRFVRCVHCGIKLPLHKSLIENPKYFVTKIFEKKGICVTWLE